MSRSASELRQAIRDEGWEGHPLANEILDKLAESETGAPGKAIAAESAGKTSKVPIITVTSLAIAALVVGYFFASSALQQRAAEIVQLRETNQALLSQKDQEIARLKDLNAKQLAQAAEQVNTAIATAQSIAKNSATAADTNNATIKQLVEELQKQRDAIRAAAPASAKP